jgi:hypothetical protein
MSNEIEVSQGRRISRRSLLGQAGVLLVSMFAGPAMALKTAAKKWDSKKELAISFSIATQDGMRARRPYVAVWIEDEKGKLVRTLAVYVQQGQKGSRWYSDLKRWYRARTDFYDATKIDLISTVSTATKAPGDYVLKWDGKDDRKALVDQGKYYVCIEAAREHGTYQLIRQDLTVGSSTFAKTLTGNVEISSAKVDYRKKA